MPTPYDLLRAELRRDGARPLLTYYDDAAGERVELSVATFDNWVTKTVGLLSEGLDVEAGDRVAIWLPAHWQSLVWGTACWTIGACVGSDERDRARVAVVGPDTLERAGSAREVVALSLRPLGGRFAEPLPAGVLDYAVEVPAYPDQLAVVPAPDAAEPAFDDGRTVLTLGGLVARANDRAEQLGAATGARLLVPTDDLATALFDALLVPLVIGGSAVLVRNENPRDREARMAAERATVASGAA